MYMCFAYPTKKFVELRRQSTAVPALMAQCEKFHDPNDAPKTNTACM